MKESDVRRLNDILLEGCSKGFESLGIDLSRDEAPTGELDCQAPVAAIIGLGGASFRGTVTIVGPFSLMCRTYPLDLKAHAEAALDVLDWTGEVANQITGLVMNRLGDEGVEVFASTPKVILSEHLSGVSLSRGSVCELRFRAKQGSVGIWLDAVAATSEGVFAKKGAGDTKPIAEGLVIFE